jgi:hypothetical protein
MRAEVADILAPLARRQGCPPRARPPRSPWTTPISAPARAAHPLAQVFPLLDDVLGQAARDCDAVMAVADEAGQLLWVCGSAARSAGRVDRLRRRQQLGRTHVAGTNAPGLALRLGAPRP